MTMRPDFQPPKLLSLRPRRTWPPPAFVWFLAGVVTTLTLLAVLGVLP